MSGSIHCVCVGGEISCPLGITGITMYYSRVSKSTISAFRSIRAPGSHAWGVGRKIQPMYDTSLLKATIKNGFWSKYCFILNIPKCAGIIVTAWLQARTTLYWMYLCMKNPTVSQAPWSSLKKTQPKSKNPATQIGGKRTKKREGGKNHFRNALSTCALIHKAYLQCDPSGL